MRAYFDRDLDTIATYWRVFRKDGVLLAFTSHDRDLHFSGIRHRSAPGMAPAAIRLTSDLSDDSAEVDGALSHDTISAADLSAGLFDEAAVEIGVVDWENHEHHAIYSGSLGKIEDDSNGFSAELRSAKRILEEDLVPRSSPTCRAAFCGKGCNLSASQFSTVDTVASIDLDANRVVPTGANGPSFDGGQLRFLDGPQTGVRFNIMSSDAGGMTLDRAIVDGTAIGTLVELREGCDHTIQTCATRFNNAINFRGEPHLPGNDQLARYGQNTD